MTLGKKRLARLTEAAGGHSPLSLFFRTHRAELMGVFSGRTNWRAVADALAAEGLFGADGGPLKPGTVRQAWYRTRQKPALTKKSLPMAPTNSIERKGTGALADVLKQMGARKPSVPAAVERERD